MEPYRLQIQFSACVCMCVGMLVCVSRGKINVAKPVVLVFSIFGSFFRRKILIKVVLR